MISRLLISLRAAAILLVALLWHAPLWAQTTIDSTTLSSAMTATQLTVTVASVTCTSCTVNSNTVIYLDQEALCVNASYVSGTTLPVTRGCLSTQATTHATSNGTFATVVFLGPSNRFHQSGGIPTAADPKGSCTRASQAFMPWINVSDGWVFTCDNYIWRGVASWGGNWGAPSKITQ